MLVPMPMYVCVHAPFFINLQLGGVLQARSEVLLHVFSFHFLNVTTNKMQMSVEQEE